MWGNIALTLNHLLENSFRKLQNRSLRNSQGKLFKKMYQKIIGKILIDLQGFLLSKLINHTKVKKDKIEDMKANKRKVVTINLPNQHTMSHILNSIIHHLMSHHMGHRMDKHMDHLINHRMNHQICLLTCHSLYH